MRYISRRLTVLLKCVTSILIVMSLSVGMSGVALAEEDAPQKSYEAVTAKQFHKFLPGKTLIGEYRHMRERSKTYNFRETHYKNGTTDYVEGPIKSKGKWYTLSTHKICYTYPDDPEMSGNISCFWVYNQDGCYYGYSMGAMTLRGPRSYNDWSARWIVKGSGGSCDAAVS